MKRLLSILVFLLALSSQLLALVKPGAQVLFERYLDSLKGKRVGVICNHTSKLPNGVHLVDTLLHSGIHVTALFAPEHGIRGAVAAGQTIASNIDSATGLHVYSLYGKTLKPTPEMLTNVDVLLFDLQDVGARFYTYASTMANCMEAARDLGKKMIVLDRPNPINGIDIEGPVLDMDLISFLGLFPLPVRHGLTLGELAKMIVGEGWLNYNSAVDLWVISMEGWKRTMWYDETRLPWVPPSPNMKSLATATVYPGTCFFEATNISEGRGTAKPFEWIGAPGNKSAKLASRLNAYRLPGVRFAPVEFTPTPDSIAAPDPKFKKRKCRGVFVHVTDRTMYRPVLTGLVMLNVFRSMFAPKFQLMQGRLDHLVGDTSIGETLMKGKLDTNILDRFKNQITDFKQRRMKYLLYE
ncbi:MAG: DUF1343 domain-containing protein [Ignavibacteriae bacterium]|nr:DUF1343 domain-containing protein [Ignavibacteria bacterium]MBI3365373.1 DUF1343 domain-containing protein [Ignavibacteriota bacterium]